jgi:8-oxo-dGTP pyrophosphatase MutT (NUDIX family)
MAISPFYGALRQLVGTQLLLMPAVAAVVRDSFGRVLIQRTQHGQWSLPAGAIEPGESPAQTLVREVHEETGLIVRAERVLAVWGGSDCRVTYPNGDLVEYVVTVFDCTAVGGELIESGDETAELRWFEPEHVPSLGLPCPLALLQGKLSVPLFAWQEGWLRR